MTEDEAKAWIVGLGVSRETFRKLETYVSLLLDEANRQNLIAESTRAHIWTRHIVDSAQLLVLAPLAQNEKYWADLGSGAGLPGVVVGILSSWNVILVESRPKRAEFLKSVISELRLLNVSVLAQRAETMILDEPVTIISARAFAPLSRTFASAHHLGNSHTLWLLPKGRSWQADMDDASKLWHASFHVEQSITDPDSAVVVAKGIRRKAQQ